MKKYTRRMSTEAHLPFFSDECVENKAESWLTLAPPSNWSLASGDREAYRWRFARLPGLLWNHGSNAGENDFIQGQKRKMKHWKIDTLSGTVLENDFVLARWEGNIVGIWKWFRMIPWGCIGPREIPQRSSWVVP